MANTVGSRKAKGRRLQQHVVDEVLKTGVAKVCGLTGNDIKSVPAGVSGPDIWLSEQARKVFPYAIECKNSERLKLWQSIRQCNLNAAQAKLKPMLVFSRNHADTYCIFKLSDIIDKLGEIE